MKDCKTISILLFQKKIIDLLYYIVSLQLGTMEPNVSGSFIFRHSVFQIICLQFFQGRLVLLGQIRLLKVQFQC